MIWLIMDVDTEFDSLRFNKEMPKPENVGLSRGVRVLLDIFEKYEVNATFHIQEQKKEEISVSSKYPKLIDTILEFGQEIGLHTHLKYADYNFRKEEIKSAMKRLKEIGLQPVSFRAGWYFSNTNTIKVLENAGIKFDCSAFKNTCAGSHNWYGIPDTPYHPDYGDIKKIGKATLLMIPITDVRLGIRIKRPAENEFKLIKKGITVVEEISKIATAPVILYLNTHSWNCYNPNGTLRSWFVKRLSDTFRFILNLETEVRSFNVKQSGENWLKGRFKPAFLNFPDLLKMYLPFYNPRKYFWFCKHVLSKVLTLYSSYRNVTAQIARL